MLRKDDRVPCMLNIPSMPGYDYTNIAKALDGARRPEDYVEECRRVALRRLEADNQNVTNDFINWETNVVVDEKDPGSADMQAMLLTWLNTFPLTAQQQDFTDLFDGARGGIAHARQAGWRSPFFVCLKCCVGGARPLSQKAWTRARVPCRAGVALLEALAEMDDTVDMEDIHRDVGEKFPFAVRNVKKFVAHLDSYYREELDMDADFEYIDAKDVGESHDEGVLTDLITLLIGCAIMVKDNQKFIERIMSLVARLSPAPAACERARAPRVHSRARVRTPSKAAARTLDQ